MTLLVGSVFHMTRKIVSEMTYNVSMGTLNPTIPYLVQPAYWMLINYVAVATVDSRAVANAVVAWKVVQYPQQLTPNTAVFIVCQPCI